MVTHVLKDGTVLRDIQGHVVTREQAPTVYKVLENIKNEGRKAHGQSRKNESLSVDRPGQ